MWNQVKEFGKNVQRGGSNVLLSALDAINVSGNSKMSTALKGLAVGGGALYGMSSAFGSSSQEKMKERGGVSVAGENSVFRDRLLFGGQSPNMLMTPGLGALLPSPHGKDWFGKGLFTLAKEDPRMADDQLAETFLGENGPLGMMSQAGEVGGAVLAGMGLTGLVGGALSGKAWAVAGGLGAMATGVSHLSRDREQDPTGIPKLLLGGAATTGLAVAMKRGEDRAAALPRPDVENDIFAYQEQKVGWDYDEAGDLKSVIEKDEIKMTRKETMEKLAELQKDPKANKAAIDELNQVIDDTWKARGNYGERTWEEAKKTAGDTVKDEIKQATTDEIKEKFLPGAEKLKERATKGSFLDRNIAKMEQHMRSPKGIKGFGTGLALAGGLALTIGAMEMGGAAIENAQIQMTQNFYSGVVKASDMGGAEMSLQARQKGQVDDVMNFSGGGGRSLSGVDMGASGDLTLSLHKLRKK